jgi:hypothetical protein
MADRYTRKDAEAAAQRLVKMLGGKWTTKGVPHDGNTWYLDWNSIYGGGVLVRYVKSSPPGESYNAESHPLWSRRLNAREWVETVYHIQAYQWLKDNPDN